MSYRAENITQHKYKYKSGEAVVTPYIVYCCMPENTNHKADGNLCLDCFANRYADFLDNYLLEMSHSPKCLRPRTYSVQVVAVQLGPCTYKAPKST